MFLNKSTLVYSLGAVLALNACTRSAAPVENTPPVVSFDVAGSVLIADAQDADNDQLTYTWIVDGQTSQGSVLALNNPQGDVMVTLQVSDGKVTVPYSQTISFGVDNQLSASISTDVSSGEAPLTVVFNGNGSSDESDDIASYNWDINSDGLNDISGAVASYEFTEPGAYSVVLNITDGDGNTALARTTINVFEPGADLEAPIAVASSDFISGQAPLNVILDGSGSSDDGSIVGYVWSVNDTVLYGQRVGHNFTDGGTYAVTLEVTDNDGLSHTHTINIEVEDANEAPTAVAAASVEMGDAPLSVTFNGSGSDDDEGIVSYEWAVNNEVETGITANYTFNNGGTYIVELTVTDTDGVTATDQITIEVNAQNGAPVAVAQASVSSGNTPLSVTFDASDSTDDGGVQNLSYAWVIDGMNFTGESVDYIFQTEDDYLVQLTVTDDDGLSSSDSITVSATTQNLAPVAVITAPTTTGVAPLTISVNGNSSTDDNDDITTYEWDVEGASSFGPTLSQTFTTSGTYTITLTVTDSDGLTGTDSVDIVVSNEPLDYDGTLPVPQDIVDQAIQDSLQPGELISGNVIYTKIPDGESPLDYPRPRTITIDENGNVVEYELPAHHVFDFGDDDYIVLDDFNDADHQNNLGGAVAINYCENYTEGGGYWYVFGDDATSIQNASGLDINAYNIIEAVERGTPGVDDERYALHVEFNVSEYAGVGTNILFEEHDVDLSNLDYIEITVKGSGEYVPMLEPLAENKPDWGNYAAYNGALGSTYSLSNSYQVIRLDASDFVGEQHSDIEGGSFEADGKHATKFFFQSKTPGVWDMYIDRIEFFGTGLNVDSMEWKNEEYDHDCPGADVENQDVPTLIPSPYIDFSTATITDAGSQTDADVKTSAELQPNGANNWLSAEENGRRLYDSNGDVVRMTGVNWFGFETKNLIPMGIWEDGRTVTEMLTHMKELGFNTVRIPFSDEVITRSRSNELTLETLDIDLTANGMNASDTPLDLLDEIIEIADGLGLKVVLDSHSRASDRYLVEGHWVSEFGTEAEWIDTWTFLADRYKDQDAVAAFDLNNEPHFEAAWGSADPAMNWNEAAERAGDAIQAIHPDVLIIVEGVEHLNGHQEMDDAQKALDSYWWGGNLKGVADYPINFAIDNTKLVYSPHEYGPEVYVQPWFKDSSFPRNLQYIWEDRFGYIYNESIGHMFIGEFGIKNDIDGSASNKWFELFVEYICDRSEGFSFTYWAWNPNSGDTGGILGNDWESENTWKLNYLNSCLAPMIGNDNG